MEKHEKFTEWALAQGIKINGVAAHRFPGRGLGIVAKKKHEVPRPDSQVPLLKCHLFCPTSVMLSPGWCFRDSLGYAPFLGSY